MGEICDICKSSFNLGDDLFTCPSCDHNFHLDHFIFWFENSKSCPNCYETLKGEIFHKSNLGIYGKQTLLKSDDFIYLEFKNKYHERGILSISKNQLLYAQSEISNEMKYLIVMKWYYFYAFVSYFFIRGIIGSYYNSTFGLKFLIIVVILLLVKELTENYLSGWFSSYLEGKPERHIIITNSVKTDLSKSSFKTIKLDEILELREYKFNNKLEHGLPGLRIFGTINLILGDNLTFENDQLRSEFLSTISKFLDKPVVEYKIDPTDSILSFPISNDIEHFRSPSNYVFVSLIGLYHIILLLASSIVFQFGIYPMLLEIIFCVIWVSVYVFILRFIDEYNILGWLKNQIKLKLTHHSS